MEKVRVKQALKHNVPYAADISYDKGQEILVHREKIVNTRIGKWLAPIPC